MFDSLNGIDWDLLHRQKRVLVEHLSRDKLNTADTQALWGIVHLIDALQDDAVAAGRWIFPCDRGRKEVRHGAKA